MKLWFSKNAVESDSNAKHVCNKCGKELGVLDVQDDFHLIRTIGYGSKYDEAMVDIQLCQSCMDELIDSCKVSPIVERQQHTN